MDAPFKYLSKTSYLFSYVSVLRFLNLMKKYRYRPSHNTMSFMIHSYWNDIFFLDLLCKHVFKHYYWLGPYSLFHKLCIKNPKMLHLTSHKFYFQVAGQGNVILRIPIFTTFCYAKNMMWVDFKCHKFNNSHFILVTKVTIHYHKKKDPGFNPIFADLDTYNSCYTQIYGKKKYCLSFHTWDIRYLYLLLIFPPFSIKESLRLKYTHPI